MHRILFVTAALSLSAVAAADEPIRKYQLVSPKDDGIIATGLNSRGDLIG